MTSNNAPGTASPERGLLGVAGIGMALFGGLFFAYFISEYASGGDGKTSTGVYAGLIVFFGGMLAAGLWLAWWSFRARPTAAGTTRPGSATTPSNAGSAPRPGTRSRAQRSGGTVATEWPGPPANPAERERRVLRLAEHERGRVTVPEVAAHCGLTIAEAKTELDRLVAEGVADLQVTASGVLVYVFAGFLSDEEKARATDF